MELKLDPESMASIASAAIFDQMPQVSRDEVIKQAIEYLLTPEKDRHQFGSVGKTPLQQAFESALRNAAFRAVEEHVKNDPQVTAHIQELLGPMINSALEGEASLYNSHLADAIGAALANWLGQISRRE